jgi:hypothetical protein
MKKLYVFALFLFLATPYVLADTQDTTVFKALMSPDNEVPPVNAPGTSGFATITVKVTRNAAGNINAATVIFEIDYTLPGPTTFTGLHIHNAPAGQNGSIVINTGISAANPVNASGSGRLTRVVDYASDATALRFVAGLLETPENYYVNIHSTTATGGLMRAPLLRTYLTLRPQMTTSQEVPAITDVDAEGAALIQIEVVRNNTGAITSGTVTFDVDYRLPAASVITGLHIHNAAAGANGGIVIDTGINNSTRSITTTTGRGNVFRTVDIPGTNTTGIAALTGLFTDPTQYYVNLHTTARPAGLIRGQLSTDTYAFFGLMTAAEENPPTPVTGTANSMTIVRVTRDSTGNIVSGIVSFNVAYSELPGPITFTGLHIHNAPFGVNGGVVINTGLSGTNTVTDDDGNGSVNRDVNVDANSPPAALPALTGLLANPEAYYVNIHTTTFGGGIIRAQLAREVYHYVAAMSPANEVPPVSSTARATGWITVKIGRNSAGAITSGQVTFDIDNAGSGSATTFTGLHIHTGAAGVNGGVVINTGLSGTNNIMTETGTGNVTRVVNIASTDTAQLAMLETLIRNPDQAYVNIHTSVNTGGLARSQMLPVLTYVPQVAGGGEWISSITINNPSTTASVHGIVNIFDATGSAMNVEVVDPIISFQIPPGGSETINVHNKGLLTTGFARIYSNANVNVTMGYNFPAFAATTTVTPVTARMVSLPVSVSGSTLSTGVAILNVTPGTLILTLRNSFGGPIAGGSRSIEVTAGQHLAGFMHEIFPDVTQSAYSGTLTVENRPGTGNGIISVLGLQFNGALAPVTVTPLP